MTILEIFKEVNRVELINDIYNKYSNTFKTKERVEDVLNIFYRDLNSLEMEELPEEYKDFVIIVNKYYDDLEDYPIENIEELTEDILESYFYVDGIHLKELIEKRDSLKYSFEEVREKNIKTLITYGLDFIDRKILINLKICEKSLKDFGILNCATEIFYEMTFYGFTNDEINERSKELDSRIESLETIEKEEQIIDEDKEDEYSFELEDFTQEYLNRSLEISMKIGSINYNNQRLFYLDYLNNYINRKEG